MSLASPPVRLGNMLRMNSSVICVLGATICIRYFDLYSWQGGITCGAIDEPRKNSKAIDKRVIINFRDKNVVIARFRDKNEAFILLLQLFSSLDSYSILSIAILIYQ